MKIDLDELNKFVNLKREIYESTIDNANFTYQYFLSARSSLYIRIFYFKILL